MDIGRALDHFPELPLDASDLVAVTVAVTSGKTCNSESFPDTSTVKHTPTQPNTGTLRITNKDKAIRKVSCADKGSEDGGPSRTRTYDQVIMSHLTCRRKWRSLTTYKIASPPLVPVLVPATR